jgi:K+:H+ antiporter subunit KhtT
VRVQQTSLPGIGVRHDLVTASGRTVGVVSHRNGRRDLVLYDVDDPDACLASIPLTDDEAWALADVLGASLMLSQLAGLRQQAAGLLTEQIALPAGSPFVGRKLGDTRARTRTSASIVAVLRDRDVIALARPVLRLRGRRRGGRGRHPPGAGRRRRDPRRRPFGLVGACTGRPC